ncbi:MAG: ABC transporter ATP-binding protein [Clostridiales bacterium]|nr:ABC transporter ATP-binding protein [Clostridiales bacterium]
MDTLLELKNLNFSYDEQPNALKNLNLKIKKGERLAVIGNNGAGKTTLFLCCNGVLQHQKGKILYEGKEISRSRSDLNFLRQRVGIVFQDANQQLIGSSVESEISFGPMNLRLPKGEVRSRVSKAMSLMNLTELRKRPPHYLSGGEKKRLTIADVLAMLPELILFDEPTAFLDMQNTDMLEKVLSDLHEKGKTLVVSTHDIDFAYRWASRILLFHKGELIADDTPSALFSRGELLSETGVRRPTFYEMGVILQRKGLLERGQNPRSLEEMKRFLDALP